MSHVAFSQTYKEIDPAILRSCSNVSEPYTTTSSGSSPQNEWFCDNSSEYQYHTKHETHMVRLRETCWRFQKQKESLTMSRNCRK
jgi:hemolysin activation/secretion protein